MTREYATSFSSNGSSPLSSAHLGKARWAPLSSTLAAERVPHTIHRVVHIPKRENVIVNRLNKTKVERVVDHEAEQIERVKRENAVKRTAAAAKVRYPTDSTPPRLTQPCRKKQISSSPRPERPRKPHVRTTRS